MFSAMSRSSMAHWLFWQKNTASRSRRSCSCGTRTRRAAHGLVLDGGPGQLTTAHTQASTRAGAAPLGEWSASPRRTGQASRPTP
jgi:hypothetical protein